MKTYSEVQRISSPLLISLLIMMILAGLSCLILIYFTNYWSELPSTDLLTMQVGFWLFVFIGLLFLSAKLETNIDGNGIHARFLPILFKWRRYAWSDLERIYVRKCNPIWEYGGWGYRIGLFGKGTALLLSGNKGVQLVLKNGRHIFIGTKNEDELASIIQYFQNEVNQQNQL